MVFPDFIGLELKREGTKFPHRALKGNGRKAGTKCSADGVWAKLDCGTPHSEEENCIDGGLVKASSNEVDLQLWKTRGERNGWPRESDDFGGNHFGVA